MMTNIHSMGVTISTIFTVHHIGTAKSPFHRDLLHLTVTAVVSISFKVYFVIIAITG